ncbi:MAG: NAD-dependent epimerase/dehydratase family protein [Gemmatimonadaceae bacterium]|jgi:2'-hydroxyisoflavone reductase|nr:NAD-dependent epimerase/dehydratase family protein [Gemmatimonadaceae bacterium]
MSDSSDSARLSRRAFVAASAVLGGALAVAPGALDAAPPPPASRMRGRRRDRRVEPLRILILGGTGFIGPHQVRYALARGHQVTIFNRGKTNPGLFDSRVEQLIGDRNAPAAEAYKSLAQRSWDVVIDNPSSLPKWVREASAVLAPRCDHYVFISTISVFSTYDRIGIAEDGPLHTPGDPNATAVTGPTYGPLKVRCEQEAMSAWGKKATIVRPGLIVGPGDLSDRFSYWPVRIEKGGDVLAPGTPDDPVQYVDARDLSEWIIRLAEENVTGTFNATGPKTPTTISEMLYGIKAVTGGDVRFTWCPADFLEQEKVRPWSDMPVWAPPKGGMVGFSRIDCRKAWGAGLTFRPLAQTAKDTLDWYHQQPADRQEKLRAGLAAAREVEVLTAWRSKTASR